MESVKEYRQLGEEARDRALRDLGASRSDVLSSSVIAEYSSRASAEMLSAIYYELRYANDLLAQRVET
ncbi:MAG TPA: hypothetical protein VFE65_20830 [Pseudonocardia sp.]|jgi:hypothetical protein|nr:hypothetical protein [Pseudonocardia sp.]